MILVSLQAAGVHNLSAKINLVTLPDLKAQTVYCVMVQCRNKDPLKRSDFTQPLCLQTEGSACFCGFVCKQNLELSAGVSGRQVASKAWLLSHCA